MSNEVYTTGGINFSPIPQVGYSSVDAKYVHTETNFKEPVEDKAAREKIRKEIEDKYIDLDMMLDACQGCTDDLDKKFAELRIYKSIIEFLGGDPEKDYNKILDRYYNNKAIKEKEKKKKFKKVKMSWVNHHNELKLNIDKTLFDLCDTFNNLVTELNKKLK